LRGCNLRKEKEFHMGFIGANNVVIDGVKTAVSGQRSELETNGIALYNAAMALEGLWTGQSHTVFEETMGTLHTDLDASLTNLDGMMLHVSDVQKGFSEMDLQYAQMLKVN
jgi:uncharacterized protein YukE